MKPNKRPDTWTLEQADACADMRKMLTELERLQRRCTAANFWPAVDELLDDAVTGFKCAHDEAHGHVTLAEELAKRKDKRQD